jgi:hypothetical protein
LLKYIWNPDPPEKVGKVYYYKFYSFPVDDDTKIIIYDNLGTFAMFTSCRMIKKFFAWELDIELDIILDWHITQYAYHYELWAKYSEPLRIIQ